MELVSADIIARKKEIIPKRMEEEFVKSPTMIKDELVLENSSLLEESGVVKKELILDNSQIDNIAVKTILASHENVKEEDTIQDEAQHTLQEIHAVIKEELMFEEKIMEQFAPLGSSALVKKI